MPVCESARLLYGRQGLVRVVRCRGCGHYYQNPRPTRETIDVYYTGAYGPHAPATAPPAAAPAARTPWHLSRPVRAIPGLRALYHWLSDPYSEPPPPGPPGRMLEIGSGQGRYLEAMQQQGWTVEGIEPAFEPGERCRARGLVVRTGRFEDFDLPPSSYDAVVMWMVVEHLHDPIRSLQAIRELLRPSGHLLFSVPNWGCWEPWAFGRHYYILNEPTHLHHFTPRTIRRLLAQSGFEVERLYHQHNAYNIVGSLGLWFADHPVSRHLGERMLAFCEAPSLFGRLALAPLAKLAAACRQGGRMTLVARPMPKRLL